MSTQKQELALEKMVENGGIVSKAMLDAGYSINTAKTPQKLTESIGFVELCEEKGLSDSLIIEALVEDIKSKIGKRKAELELAFKIKGHLQIKNNIYNLLNQKTELTPERKAEIDRAFENFSM